MDGFIMSKRIRKASETSAIAYRESLKREGTVKGLILDAFEAAGDRGLTREECATATGLPIQSVCRPVLDLLQASWLVKTDRRRLTRYGKAADVLVFREGMTDA